MVLPIYFLGGVGLLGGRVIPLFPPLPGLECGFGWFGLLGGVGLLGLVGCFPIILVFQMLHNGLV